MTAVFMLVTLIIIFGYYFMKVCQELDNVREGLNYAKKAIARLSQENAALKKSVNPKRRVKRDE